MRLTPSGPSPRIGEELRKAAARFSFSATPRLDAELLMAHAFGIERSALLLDLDRAVPVGWDMLVDRRARQEPIAYITGTRGFWTVDLAVGPGALVPRADSETLLLAAQEHFVGRAPATVLDLGTGPGTLLLAALDEWPDACGIGVDRSAEALAYARVNVAGSGGRARLVQGDWAAALDTRFDLVLANPPYVGTDEVIADEVRYYEPVAALFAGADGLDVYRVLVPQLPELIAPGGVAVLEIGATQAMAVASLVEQVGLNARVRQDFGGRDRCIVVTP